MYYYVLHTLGPFLFSKVCVCVLYTLVVLCIIHAVIIFVCCVLVVKNLMMKFTAHVVLLLSINKPSHSVYTKYKINSGNAFSSFIFHKINN